MKIGYCVPITPNLASYRLRVEIPSPLLGCEYEIGTIGPVTFFYKHFEGDLDLARTARPFVYDVVNDHFDGQLGNHYRAMCAQAHTITCASDVMAATVLHHTGREAVVIDDPYENDEVEPACVGRGVLWFGHQANISSLAKYVTRTDLTICSNWPHHAVRQWSQGEERRLLNTTAVVLMTGNNPGASSNRVVKALRAGRFVVTPGGVPAWDALREFIWVGDVEEGISWALANREEVCEKISAGQEFVKARNSPAQIAARWMGVFGSISPQVTSSSPDGLALI